MAEDRKEKGKKYSLGNVGTAAGGMMIGTPIALAAQGAIARPEVLVKLYDRVVNNPAHTTDATVKSTLERLGGAHVSGDAAYHAVNTKILPVHDIINKNRYDPDVYYAVINYRNGMPKMLPGRMFPDNKPRISMDNVHSNDALMHELGHEMSSRRKYFDTTRLKELANSKVGQGVVGAAVLGSMVDDDKRKYIPLLGELPHAVTMLDEQHANVNAMRAIAKHQGMKGALGFAKNVMPYNVASYAAESTPRLIGGYAGIAAMEKIRDMYRNKNTVGAAVEKQASEVGDLAGKGWKHYAAEAGKDFAVIGSADLAAMGAYDRIHRNDGPATVRVEYPENRYLQKVAERLEKEAGFLSTVTNGAKAAWSAVKSTAGTAAKGLETSHPDLHAQVASGFNHAKTFANNHPIATAVGASVVANRVINGGGGRRNDQ